MRTFMVAAAFASALLFLETSWTNSSAYAEGTCTGENCKSQGASGRDCERSKTDQSVS